SGFDPQRLSGPRAPSVSGHRAHRAPPQRDGPLRRHLMRSGKQLSRRLTQMNADGTKSPYQRSSAFICGQNAARGQAAIEFALLYAGAILPLTFMTIFVAQ